MTATDRIPRAPHQALSATQAAAFLGISREVFAKSNYPRSNPGADGRATYTELTLLEYQKQLAIQAAGQVAS